MKFCGQPRLILVIGFIRALHPWVLRGRGAAVAGSICESDLMHHARRLVR